MNAEELFDKLIKNQISKEEFDQLLEGMDDQDTLARYEVFLQQQFEKELDQHFEDEDQKVEPIQSKLKVLKETTSDKKISKGKKSNRNLPLAAIFVLFVGLVASTLFLISQNNFSSAKDIVTNTSYEPQIITKSTPKGRMFRMNLDDGSFVHLNAVSSISYPNKFGLDKREIEIEGEAYFNVKRDETKPFNIKVKDVEVEVLGTSFSIQAYDDEDDISVVVESGSVRVNLDKEGINTAVLEKNQKLVHNPITNVTEIFDVVSNEELSWRNGVLRFVSTPMDDVEKRLERWYGIDLVIDNPDIYKKTISGIHQNENLKSVIEALTYATGTKYIIKGNSIIIKN